MKNALVSGASGGIGLAITKLLAAEGVRLMLVAKETLTALKKRKKPVVVSGIMNRGMALSQRFMSRKQVVNMMGRVSPVK